MGDAYLGLWPNSLLDGIYVPASPENVVRVRARIAPRVCPDESLHFTSILTIHTTMNKRHTSDPSKMPLSTTSDQYADILFAALADFLRRLAGGLIPLPCAQLPCGYVSDFDRYRCMATGADHGRAFFWRPVLGFTKSLKSEKRAKSQRD